MKRETNLCMSCMTEKPEVTLESGVTAECPHCGWTDNGVHLASYLYPQTFLADRYIVGKLISYNGEAALYGGYDTLTEVRISIKEYMPDALCTRDREVLPLTVNSGELPLYKTYLSEFVELNRSLQSLGSSPGIQRVTDVFSENSTAYAIYEYASGISMATYLLNSGGFLGSQQVKELFPPIFAALGRINATGTIHRGISPKTVFVKLVDNKPELYMTDFAITAARIFGSKINSEVFSGYAAPEQYNSFERHGDWTDVYGLAALLYNAMTGITPQDATARLNDDLLVEPMLINRDIPSNISKAITKGMELSPEKRIKTISEFSRLLWGAVRPINTGDTIAFASVPSVTARAETDVSQLDFDSTYAEEDDFEDAAELRRQEKEKIRKKKMIIALSAISAVVVLFLILIILAVAGIINPGSRDPDSNLAPDETGNATVTAKNNNTDEPDTKFQVINFVGENFNEDWAKDEELNFLKFNFVPEYSDDPERPYGIVFYQSVKRGKTVSKGTNITIKYSLGPEFATMPDYTGSTIDVFKNQLIELGVKIENIVVRDNESPFYYQPNMVDSCNIGPNDSMRITSFPGDNTRQAVTIMIYRAIPLGGEPDSTEPPPPTTPPLPTVAPPKATTTPPVTAAPPKTTTPPPVTAAPPKTTTTPRVIATPPPTTTSIEPDHLLP